MTDYPTVGTEAMSDAARPRSLDGVRLVEEGRERERAPATDVPCPENPHVRRLSWRVSRMEAVNEDRGVRIMAGRVREDIEALPESDDLTFAFLGYRGSHDLLDGHVALQADLCGLAQAMNRAIDECWEKFVEERSEKP